MKFSQAKQVKQENKQITISSTHRHTHNRFTAGLEYVWVHPGQQVPER